MESQEIIVQRDGAIARVILNRPDQLNALTKKMYQELPRIYRDLDEDSAVRVIILSGNGKVFCAGADLKWIQAQQSSGEGLPNEMVHDAYGSIEKCGKPVIAAVQGMALAGGLELVNCCDLVIAAEDARLGDQHAKFGLIPGGGGSQRLPRLIGVRRATELLLTGKWISAAEAERIGLVNKVVPPDQLSAAADELAGEIAQRSPLGSRAIKRLVQDGMQVDLQTGLAMERTALDEHSKTQDFKEGLLAFAEKRKPVFPGA